LHCCNQRRPELYTDFHGFIKASLIFATQISA